MTEERKTFETFIRELRDFILALAKEPITSGSGLYKPRKQTQIHYLTHPRKTITHPRKTIMHPQRTYQDMKGEIANQLVRLPDYIARVKIKGEPEHTIRTIKPAAGFYGKVLQDRVDRIQAHNRKPNPYGYTRSRQDIEAEITKRQSQCSQQALLPHQPQPLQPPQVGRKAKVCQYCSTLNRQDATFCDHCGTQF